MGEKIQSSCVKSLQAEWSNVYCNGVVILQKLCLHARNQRALFAGQCRPVATRAELREVIVEMSKAAQVGKLSQGEAQQVTSEV